MTQMQFFEMNFNMELKQGLIQQIEKTQFSEIKMSLSAGND
jgi:hypothetical protein